MRDPFSWSVPLGRLFGINIRVHILFPLVVLGFILRAAYGKDYLAGSWIDAAMLMFLLFGVVLLHEFGHCFGARMVEGEANEVLLWPLGGLASIEVPHTPRANFIATAAGPLTNLLICFVVGSIFLWVTDFHLRPTWNPFWYPLRVDPEGAIRLFYWDGQEEYTTNLLVIILARTFWVSWWLFLFNVVLIGFPLDGGRMFQCILWPYYGYRQATMAAVIAGFITTLILGIIGIVTNEVLTLCLALFIYVSCRQQWVLLETGGEESLFGYDFSQGYTSLEQDPPAPKPRRPNFIQRWLQRRAARKLQREIEEREAEERRMDELLDKIQQQGKQSLTDEELRFMTRVSNRYRNKRP
ncbi:MAG: site-2 protease family protein [Gemmataceae bacterium]